MSINLDEEALLCFMVILTESLLSKNGAEIQGTGGLFSRSNHLSGGGGTAPHFCIYGSSPTEQVFLSDGPRMCLSGDPFVPKMGAVRAEESCGFELENRPQTPGSEAYRGT